MNGAAHYSSPVDRWATQGTWPTHDSSKQFVTRRRVNWTPHRSHNQHHDVQGAPNAGLETNGLNSKAEKKNDRTGRKAAVSRRLFIQFVVFFVALLCGLCY